MKKFKFQKLVAFMIALFCMLDFLGVGFNKNVQAATTGQSIVSYAKSHLGDYYIWGASGPNTFDCSGFTSYVYKHFGYNIPRTSKAQSTAGKYVSKANLKPGDLVFFYKPVSHVGIYIGNGEFINAGGGDSSCTSIAIAKKRNAKVKINTLSSGYYSLHYNTARRIINN